MRCLALLLLLSGLPLVGQRKIRPVPTQETLACGSGIHWRVRVKQALLEAKKSRRPVFWYVPTVQGSHMDRRIEINHYMLAGPFSDPTLETLLNRRFIPVKAVAKGELQKHYGLRNMLFIEPGFLVLDPAGTVLARVDKISTFNNPWFVWQVRRSLEARQDLNRDSPEVAAARASKDGEALARALLQEGDVAGAARALPKRVPGESESARRRYLRARLAAAGRDDGLAQSLLAGLLKVFPGRAATELGRLFLAQDRPRAALPFFLKASKRPSPRQQEAAFFVGVCQQLLLQGDQALLLWKRLAKQQPESRWTRKASAESQRLGPFSRCFERFDRIPEAAFLKNPDGTRWPRKLKDLPDIIKRSVHLLLETQKQSGIWDDSNYDFGGTNSLPNVYAAGTALAARALLEWPEVAGKAGRQAVDRAFKSLLDESHLALKDRNEIVWAHAYRLYFLEKVITLGGPRAARARAKAREIVGALSRFQLKTGAWRHEYPNPMATATVVTCLAPMPGVGVSIGQKMLQGAARALALCRGADGTFTYGMPRRQSRRRPTAVEFAAGRMPLCEVAMLEAGASSQERLAGALKAAFQQHHYLEGVRKYDDHADRFHNGGFFFWYDMLGRALAINHLKDRAQRERYRKQELGEILLLPEIDGGFVDSHELGKTYGTAMALLCIKALWTRLP